MAANSIWLNGRQISFADIRSGLVNGDTPFEKATLTFCRQWLNGQEIFTIKTSGSTGKPKSISVSRNQMQASARQTIRFFNITQQDTLLVCLPTAYIAGMMMLVRAFEAAARIVAVEPAGNPLAACQQKVDFVALVPLQLQQVLADSASRQKLQACRAAIVGGAPLTPQLEQDLQGFPTPVYATFGMTETLTHFALRALSPTPETDYQALDQVTIGLDARGCLTVSSPGTGQQTIVTNDLAVITAPGRFRWLGRYDHVINSGGIKLQTEELEQQVAHLWQQTGHQERFFITALPDSRLGQKVALVIESAASPQAFRQLPWDDYFDRYARPKEILTVTHFAETPTGKIDRQATLQQLSDGH